MGSGQRGTGATGRTGAHAATGRPPSDLLEPPAGGVGGVPPGSTRAQWIPCESAGPRSPTGQQAPPAHDGPAAAYGRVRRQPVLDALLARLRGRPNSLLAYLEVRRGLALRGESYRGLLAVPVASIVGSTDRAADFDRAFRPRRDHCAARWVSVARTCAEGKALPPVQLDQVGEDYFARDGHHRVRTESRTERVDQSIGAPGA